MRPAAILVLAAACGSPDPAVKPAPFPWPSRVTRSPPEPFLGEPGLTQVLESTHRPDDRGYTASTRLLVLRGGAVVCEVPYGAASVHEKHRFFESTQLFVSSRAPLRFRTRTSSHDRDFGSRSTCREYELSDDRACTKLFDKPCRVVCKLTYTSVVKAGTGVIRGRVTREHEPLLGAVLSAGDHIAISDEHGAFSMMVPPGTHHIAITEDNDVVGPKPNISIEHGQDVELEIAIRCSGS